MSLLARIEHNLPALTAAEASVARWVIHNPKLFLREPIGKIAQASGASQPTVIRFCRSLGYAGLKDFRLDLAREPMGEPYIHPSTQAHDSTETWVAKVLTSHAQAVRQAAQGFDAATLNAVIDQINQSKNLEFWGLGQSAIVAKDAQHKLFRIGFPIIVQSDAHVQTMSAALATPEHTIVAISASGNSEDLVAAVRQARLNGACVVGLCRCPSRLARCVDWLLPVNTEEDPAMYTPMASRIAHLAVIDLLTVGLTHRRREQLLPRLRQMKNKLKQLKPI